MVTELLRLWLLEPPLTEAPPWAMAGAATAGTAGEIGALPFTGETEDDFPCCTGAEPPTATAGEGVEEPVAMGADETAFLAVEAYDEVDDALEEFAGWLGIWDCWETEVIGGTGVESRERGRVVMGWAEGGMTLSRRLGDFFFLSGAPGIKPGDSKRERHAVDGRRSGEEVSWSKLIASLVRRDGPVLRRSYFFLSRGIEGETVATREESEAERSEGAGSGDSVNIGDGVQALRDLLRGRRRRRY
jgi:hypothetical protein